MFQVGSPFILLKFCNEKGTFTALVDPGRGACWHAPSPATGSNSFIFAYVFAKIARVGGRRPSPPMAGRPPTGNPGSATV